MTEAEKMREACVAAIIEATRHDGEGDLNEACAEAFNGGNKLDMSARLEHFGNALASAVSALELPAPEPQGVTITDAMVEAALRAWYPGEWPDGSAFKKDGQRTSFAEATWKEMQQTLAFALGQSQPRNVVGEEIPAQRIAWVAHVLHQKFGVQCSMGEKEMWVPIARAALEVPPLPNPPAAEDRDASRDLLPVSAMSASTRAMLGIPPAAPSEDEVEREVNEVVVWATEFLDCYDHVGTGSGPSEAYLKHWGGMMARLRALPTILAALPRPAVSGWRSMESAPRDGTPVDLWCQSKGLSAGPSRVPDCWFSAGKWWRYDDNGDDQCRSQVSNATHWQPLPEPPLAASPTAPEGK